MIVDVVDDIQLHAIEYQEANFIISCMPQFGGKYGHNYHMYIPTFFLDIPSSILYLLDLHNIFEPFGYPNWTHVCFDHPQLQKLPRIETKHTITESFNKYTNDNDQSRKW